MHQVVTTVIVCTCLVVAPAAQARDGASEAAATIARARRLIDAKDYASATTLLEDLLLETKAEERATILGILRQSYEVMAREAEAAGRDREAADYRENLAILGASEVAPERTEPAKPRTQAPSRPKSTAETIVTAVEKVKDQAHAKDLTNLVEKVKDQARATDLTNLVEKVKDQARATDLTNLVEKVKDQARATDLTNLVEKVKDQARATDLTTLISAPNQDPIVPAPAEPAPLAEPASLPKLERDPGRPPGSRSNRAATVSQISGQGTPVPGRDDTGPEAKDAAPTIGPAAAQQSPPSETTPASDATTRPASIERAPTGPTLEEADRLFSAKQYNEAGQCYLALAREKRLPVERANHWAYCRIVGVAVRMNARPKTAREWDELEAEIQSIQRLAPNLWYGEYLRNKLAEVRQGRSRTKAQGGNLVVRGSAPDDSQPRRFPRLFGKSRAATPSTANASSTPISAAPGAGPDEAQQSLSLAADRGGPKPAVEENTGNDDRTAAAATSAQPSQPASGAATPTGDESTTVPSGGPLQVHETRNFRIFHADARLAERAGEAAESVRAAQARRWGSAALQKPWMPRCDLYLYPNGKAFAEATSQPETSPGFSTMENNGNRITVRRVYLRADNPRVLDAVLPHEVTHVVLADLFIVQQIPRWADEGIAVLAEPSSEQNLRAMDLQESLAAGQIFELRKLMSVETPDARDWSLYYAQSVSLTRFLVERGSPEQLIQFVRESHRKGIEPALRDVYRLGGFADLQARWQAYAREQLATNKVADAGEDLPAQPSATEDSRQAKRDVDTTTNPSTIR